MVTDALVVDVNSKLGALLNECQAHKENPHLIELIKQVRRLTNMQPETEEETSGQDSAAAPESAAPAAAPDPSDCEHKVVNVYGKCVACGDCSHPQVKDGVCITCDEKVG